MCNPEALVEAWGKLQLKGEVVLWTAEHVYYIIMDTYSMAYIMICCIVTYLYERYMYHVM